MKYTWTMSSPEPETSPPINKFIFNKKLRECWAQKMIFRLLLLNTAALFWQVATKCKTLHE